ncbi:MAG: hypothetical protein CSA62_13510 [Planctomycetota bacterium]|nr:MAG: hypothetical protein CSA62_13510 [Planctomycetota bacterium]
MLLGSLGMLPACSVVPSERAQEILIRNGFGRRAQGDAQVENYASVGSTIEFIPSSQDLLRDPAFRDLALLVSTPQVVAVDGTVYVPGVGPLLVLGLTEREMGQLITEQLGALYSTPPRIDARISSDTKYYFLFGEVGPARRELRGDTTIVDVFAEVERNDYANMGRIRLIRADPRNPLVVSINFHDIGRRGFSAYNLRIRENDIIYVPPTFFGMVARFLNKLLLPLKAVVTGLLEVSSVNHQIGVLTGKNDYYYPLIY